MWKNYTPSHFPSTVECKNINKCDVFKSDILLLVYNKNNIYKSGYEKSKTISLFF